MTLVYATVKDQLEVRVFDTRMSMGRVAAKDVAAKMKQLIKAKGVINMVFAAAPSQNDFLADLVADQGIDWSKVVAFHLDEYVGLPEDAPQRFGNFLKDRLFDQVNFKQVYYIDVPGKSADELIRRYSRLLKENPIDIACIGIGENGHIAFNDPHVADFADPANIKLVDLDETCRQQQVNDGCFASIEEVPTHAYTMTVPAILSADYIYCMVPTKNKSKAVQQTVEGAIEPICPASILRSHQRSILYLDVAAADRLDQGAKAS